LSFLLTAAELYQIQNLREGYLHHTGFTSDGRSLDDVEETMPGFGANELENQRAAVRRKDKREFGVVKAGPRRYRSGKQGYRQSMFDSISEYTRKMNYEQIRNGTHRNMEQMLMKSAEEVEALKLSDPALAARMVPYQPAFKHSGIEPGTPLFVDSWVKDLLSESAGMSEMLMEMNDVLNIGKKNVLAHTGTFSGNAISGVFQHGTYLLENLFKGLAGDKVAMRRITNSARAFTNARKMQIPSEMFGASSNRVAQYGAKGKGFFRQLGDVMLTPMGAIDTYFKKLLTRNELLARGMDVKDLIDDAGRIKDLSTFTDVTNIIDQYALNYSNVSPFVEWLRKHPAGTMMMPFATFPYKFTKSTAYYLNAFNPKELKRVFNKSKLIEELGEEGAKAYRRDWMAKLLTMSTYTLGGIGAGMAFGDEDMAPDFEEGMDYQSKTTGFMHLGFMNEDSYVRFAKYPGANVMGNFYKMGERIKSGRTLTEISNATFDELTDSYGDMWSVGGSASLLANMAGYKDKFSGKKSVGQQFTAWGIQHTPGLGMFSRWGPDINRMVEEYQGLPSRSVRTAEQQLYRVIPFSVLTHPHKQGDITSFSQPRENEGWRLLSLYQKQIPKRKVEQEKRRAKLSKARREKKQEQRNKLGRYIR